MIVDTMRMVFTTVSWVIWNVKIVVISESGGSKTMPKRNRKKKEVLAGSPPPARSRGRPVEHPLPPVIPATPEELARAVANTPPPKEWKYMKRKKED